MARIPEIELTRLKQEISLQRLAESAGIVLKRHGADRPMESGLAIRYC